MKSRIGEEFQELTSYRAIRAETDALHGHEAHGPGWRSGPKRSLGREERMPGVRSSAKRSVNAGAIPGVEVEGREKQGKVTPLPEPMISGGNGVWDTIAARRSVREYGHSPLALRELSQLLWAMQGITAVRYGHGFRAAPSAGALYPVDTYAVVHKVEDLGPGVYRYMPGEHALEAIRSGDFRTQARQAALGQSMASDAPVLFVWTAVPGRSIPKYGQRAYRYVYLDAGHIAQNLALAAAAMGLGSCQIGALFDDLSNELVGADGEREAVLYMSPVGRPPGK